MGSKAALESVPFSFRFTAMPFLYQTRTIASLQWRKSAIQTRIISTTGTRGYGSVRRTVDDGDHGNRRQLSRLDAFKPLQVRGSKGIEDSSTTADRNSGLTIKRTTNIHGPEAAQYDGWSADSNIEISEGMAGGIIRKTWMVPEDLIDQNLINKRGQANSLDGERRRQNVAFDEFGTSDGKDVDSINFSEEDNIYEEKDAIDQLTSKMDPDLDRTSTITPSEKQVFQKLFSDIFARQQQQAVRKAPPSLDLFKDESTNDVHVESKDTTKAMKSIGKIMANATRQLTNEEMEETVKRYPAALRAAAARAIGFKLNASQDQSEKERIGDEAMDLKLEELRKPERERVERLMRAAATDFELWSVMEKEVFSLIPRLGLGNMKTEPLAKTVAKKSKKARKKKAIAVVTTNADEPQVVLTEPTSTSTEDGESLTMTLEDEVSTAEPSSTTITEDGISALARDGPLYPSHLLLGLRLLDRSFAKPSLLTLSILPKIKSLGLFSHVLGGTTQLYNELMIIHWHRRDDFPAVLSLLKEMEQSALDWDKHTLEIISTIDATQKSALKGERGRELNTLWTLPAFAPSSFGGWREKIKQALMERERETARQHTNVLY